MTILVVKTSSLGDIIQALPILPYLRNRFPDSAIDWAVEERLSSAVSAHPFVRKAIPVSRSNMIASMQALRKESYDLVFDLQGNCKSALWTFLSRGKTKVGLGLRSVREWPNILATHIRFDVPQDKNMRRQYLCVLQQFFQDREEPHDFPGLCFSIDAEQKKQVDELLRSAAGLKIMVCPGSAWPNKQLPVATLRDFLRQIKERYSASFFLLWGSQEEREYCKNLQEGILVDKLPLPTWQYFMHQVDLVIAMDSSALHLCGTTSTPSFSVFGPTSAAIFQPIGPLHYAFSGTCPYGQTFVKSCPLLRTCPTGACMRDISPDALFQAFASWWAKQKTKMRASKPLFDIT